MYSQYTPTVANLDFIHRQASVLTDKITPPQISYLHYTPGADDIQIYPDFSASILTALGSGSFCSRHQNVNKDLSDGTMALGPRILQVNNSNTL